MLACLSTLDKDFTNTAGKMHLKKLRTFSRKKNSMKKLHREKFLSFVALCYLKFYYVSSMKIFAEDFFM